MHEVAVSSSCAGVLFILSTGRLSEVCHRAELNLNRPASIEASLQPLQGCCSTLFIRELHIHAADHVICQVITDIQILNFAKLCKLLKDVFIKVLSEEQECQDVCKQSKYTRILAITTALGISNLHAH